MCKGISPKLWELFGIANSEPLLTMAQSAYTGC